MQRLTIGYLLAFCCASIAAAFAPPVRAAAAEKTVFAVVVTRHGVRSITSTPDAYRWADWSPVAPGFLSAHGYRLVTFMGEFYRSYFAARGIPLDCRTHDAFVYADVDQRTLATGRALVDGLCGSPDALPMYHERDASGATEDPLFNATAFVKAAGHLDAARSRDAVAQAAPNPPGDIVQANAADFGSLQAMLDARCAPGADCTSVTHGESTIAARKGLAELTGPLKAASDYAEDMFLEYAQCRPLAEFGIDDPVEFAERLQSAMRLHVLQYDVNARNAYNPLVRGGNLFAHIVGMLQAKAGLAHPGVEVPALTNDDVAIFSGHDTQLGALGGILGAHWHFGDGLVDDDMPPGGAMIFELYRTATGEYRVRVRYAFETLAQFRSATRLAGGVKTVPVTFDGCRGDDCSAPLSRFAALATALVNEGFVDSAWTPDTDAPVNLAPLVDPPWTKCTGAPA